MRVMKRWSWYAASLAAGVLMMPGAGAEESLGGEVAGAMLENPECVGAAIANQAVEEGVRRGRRLLSRLGVNAAPRAATVPCADGGTAAAAAPAPAPAAAAAPAPAATAAPAPAPAPTAAPRGGLFSGLRQRANAPSQGRRDCGALGAGCADGMEPLVACMREVSFWGEMAVAVERKRDAGGDYSVEQLAEIDADIASMRAAHASGAGSVEPADPARPNRYLDWLTPDEYSVAATAAAQTLTKHREECNRKYARF